MSTDYWKEREYYNLLKSKNRDEAYVKGQIEDIYNDLLLNLEREIRAEIVNFSNAEGISIGEAKKRIGKADIKYYESVAKKYVADKDFTEKANHEMKLYNITMRLNRLEFLNAILRAHIIGAGARLETSLASHLLKGSIDEYKRQAGILNLSIADKDIERRAKFIVSQDYYNAHFSDRIWRDTKELQRRVARNIDSVVIQGNNPQVFARKLRDLVKGDIKNARSATERLAFTESGRVWVETQIDAYRAGGYKYLEILTEPTACKQCSPHNGDIVRLDEVREGDNVPLWHPRCRCTTVAYEIEDSQVKDLGYWDDGENRYEVDGHHVVLDYSPHEREIGELLATELNKTVYMVPRVLNPKEISTPDYLIDGERWDLKDIYGNKNKTMYNALKGTRKQADHFIFDITNTSLTYADSVSQINDIFKSRHRDYVKEIILIENNQILDDLKK